MITLSVITLFKHGIQILKGLIFKLIKYIHEFPYKAISNVYYLTLKPSIKTKRTRDLASLARSNNTKESQRTYICLLITYLFFF